MFRNSLFVVAVMCVAIVSASSGVSTKVKVKKLLIAKQLSPWVEQKETTQSFSAHGLFDVINGGAEVYIGQGLIEGIHQQFTAKDGKTVEVFAEDFGTPEKASAMMKVKKEEFSETKPISGLTDIENALSKAIGASVVIASIGRFYFEITVSGFSDDKDTEGAAISFINYYKKLIGK